MKNIYKIYAIAISTFIPFNFSLNINNCDAQWILHIYGFASSQANGLAYIGSTVFTSSNSSGVFTKYTTFKRNILSKTHNMGLCRHEKDVEDYIIESIVF